MVQFQKPQKFFNPAFLAYTGQAENMPAPLLPNTGLGMVGMNFGNVIMPHFFPPDMCVFLSWPELILLRFPGGQFPVHPSVPLVRVPMTGSVPAARGARGRQGQGRSTGRKQDQVGVSGTGSGAISPSGGGRARYTQSHSGTTQGSQSSQMDFASSQGYSQRPFTQQSLGGSQQSVGSQYEFSFPTLSQEGFGDFKYGCHASPLTVLVPKALP